MSLILKSAVAEITANSSPRIQAMDQDEWVEVKIDDDFSAQCSFTAAYKHAQGGDYPFMEAAQTLAQIEAVGGIVEKCAEKPHSANSFLTLELYERKALERELVNLQAKLIGTQIELLDTQVELARSKTAEKNARHLAFHDATTGLPNRTLFNDRLAHALAQTQRHERALAVMFIDLDKFKAVNDTYGHYVGDKLLQAVAERLRSSVRSADTVARQGGDEFLYLVEGVRDQQSAESIAAKLISIIGQPYEIDGHTLSITPSVGVAMFPRDGKTTEDLIKNADTAMYIAKKTNNGYVMFNASRPLA